jgi:uncharacterized protein (DUF1697 family)
MQYVALLRGIGPGNPNMRNEKLRGVFEDLGFGNVMSVISSGNVLFETDSKDAASLERRIEEKMFEQLGFHTTTIIRSRDQLKKLAQKRPFGDAEHSPKSSLNVTFLKNAQNSRTKPHAPEVEAYEVVSIFSDAICSVVDTTAAKTPKLMSWLEKEFGKQATTRTWMTILKILNKWES